jgi:hypothetical protein
MSVLGLSNVWQVSCQRLQLLTTLTPYSQPFGCTGCTQEVMPMRWGNNAELGTQQAYKQHTLLQTPPGCGTRAAPARHQEQPRMAMYLCVVIGICRVEPGHKHHRVADYFTPAAAHSAVACL